jgi:hypothetical protein
MRNETQGRTALPRHRPRAQWTSSECAGGDRWSSAKAASVTGLSRPGGHCSVGRAGAVCRRLPRMDLWAARSIARPGRSGRGVPLPLPAVVPGAREPRGVAHVACQQSRTGSARRAAASPIDHGFGYPLAWKLYVQDARLLLPRGAWRRVPLRAGDRRVRSADAGPSVRPPQTDVDARGAVRPASVLGETQPGRCGLRLQALGVSEAGALRRASAHGLDGDDGCDEGERGPQ